MTLPAASGDSVAATLGVLGSMLELDAATMERVDAALAGVPRMAYSVPHVYPSAAPAYLLAPLVQRPPLIGDQLRLYVHIPFCRYHCTFCHYAVRAGAGTELMKRYVRALERELEWVEPGTPLSQLFVGGGTPTALSPELLDAVLTAIFTRTVAYGHNVHVVETSPETISPSHIEVLQRHGIGRMSLGVQSLDDGVLGAVHREQTGAEALAACELLVDAGFIVNVDLIYGLPRQTPKMLLDDIRAVAERGVHSLTLYSLRVNERTPVIRTLGAEERLDLPRLMHWRAFITRHAEELGFTQTRWHTFKRLDTIARMHERLPCFDQRMLGYQLGVGMSARSHLGRVIYRNHEQLAVYLDRVERRRSPVEQVFPLGEDDLRTQFIARTIGDGQAVVRSAYASTFGSTIDDDFGDVLARLTAAALIEDRGETLVLSPLGKLVYDVVTLAFYPKRAQAWLAARTARPDLLQSEVTAEAS